MKLHYPLNPTTGVEDATLLPWTDGVPQTAQEGSFPPSAAVVEPMTELANFVGLTGQVGTSSDLFQVARGVRSGQLDFCGTDTGTADAVVCKVGLAHAQVIAGLPFTFFKGPNDNTGAALTLTITDPQGNNPISGTVLKNTGKSPAKGDLPANSLVTVRADSSGRWRLISLLTVGDVLALIQANTRTLLRANVTVYARPDGSDASTDGRSDTAASAFKTPTGAFNAVAQLYILAGFSITIQLSKTYAAQVLGSAQPVSYPGLIASNVGVSGTITLQGDPAAPQNYVLTPVAVGDGSMTCCFSGIQTLATTGVTANVSSLAQGTSGSAFRAGGGATLGLGTVTVSCAVSNTALNLVSQDPGGTITLNGAMTFTGGGTVNSVFAIAGNFGPVSASTIAISNFTFNQFFFVTGGPGNAVLALLTFTGSGNTGARWLVNKNATLDPSTVALTAIPGNAAGTKSSGGQVIGDTGPAWTTGTAGITASSGALGTAATYYRYQQTGRTVVFEMQVNIGAVGSATGSIITNLPIAPLSNVAFFGCETSATGKVVSMRPGGSGTQVQIQNYDNSSAIVAGAIMFFTGIYEAAF